MCNYLTFYYTCGYHASTRFRTAECLHVSDATRCRDHDYRTVLPYSCRYCQNGHQRRSHPVTILPLTPPPSPGSEEDEAVWVVPSRCELFHRQPGFQCYDPFKADRNKQRTMKWLRLLPATKAEPIDLDEADAEGESPMTNGSDEDPFGPQGVRPSPDKKWNFNFLRQEKPIETSRCCLQIAESTSAMSGYVVDDRCTSTI